MVTDVTVREVSDQNTNLPFQLQPGTLHGCQPFPRARILSGGAKHSLSTGASSTPSYRAPEPSVTSLGQGRARQAED